MSGGQDGLSSPMFDNGAFAIMVNNHANQVDWGEGSTPQTIAMDLATEINSDPGAFVTASVAGNTISLRAKSGGVATNYSWFPVVINDILDFPLQSFGFQTSGTQLTGGT